MPKPYVAIPGQDCWLADQRNEMVCLNDTSSWMIAPEDQEQVQKWVRFSPIQVIPADDGDFPYVLANRSLAQQARASYLGLEQVKPHPTSTPWVARVPGVLGNVGLLASLLAIIAFILQPRFGNISWQQIGNRVYPFLLRPGSALASGILRTTDVSWSMLLLNWLFYAFLILCLGAVGLRKRI